MMQTFAIEARRTADGPWMTVTTVQEDLRNFAEAEIAEELASGNWQIRPLDEMVKRRAESGETAKITVWDRLKWWAMFRFTPKARR